MLQNSLLLLLCFSLGGCQTFCKKFVPGNVGSGTIVEISEELLAECEKLEPLVVSKEDSEPFIAVLESHKNNVAAYARCAAAKRDLNKVARSLANKEIK